MSRSNVWGSISQKSTVPPQYKTELAVAANVKGVVITRFPGPTPRARADKWSAAVPLATAMAYREPI